MPTLSKIGNRFRAFIEKQPMFFVATAGRDGRVNVSPKGMDTLKVINDNRVVWLNLTGSGNETAAHVLETERMTLMFCAFEGDALILRLYGTAKVLHPRSENWAEAVAGFPQFAGSRQIFDLNVDMVQSSCGSGVPYMDFNRSRGESELVPYFNEMGEEGVEKYWTKKNAVSLDGKTTGIINED